MGFHRKKLRKCLGCGLQKHRKEALGLCEGNDDMSHISTDQVTDIWRYWQKLQGHTARPSMPSGCAGISNERRKALSKLYQQLNWQSPSPLRPKAPDKPRDSIYTKVTNGIERNRMKESKDPTAKILPPPPPKLHELPAGLMKSTLLVRIRIPTLFY